MQLTITLAIEIAYALGIGMLLGLERLVASEAAAKDAAEREAAGDVAGELPGGAPKKAEAGAAGKDAEGAKKDEAAKKDDEAAKKDDEAAKKDDVAAKKAASAETTDAVPDSTLPAPAGGRDEGLDLVGLRTFTILSLFGYASALAAEQIPHVPLIALGGVILLIIAMYFRAHMLDAGITTEAAAISACALGMLCHHHYKPAAVIALLITVLLASKRFTRKLVSNVRRVELTDTLKFLVVILIVLPLLPNRALDPYGAFNPYKVGVLVVLVSGIGFAGYFLTRILGAQRGLGLTGIVGGLTSSTAVTAAMAVQAKERPALRAICAFSTVAANATMFVRVLVVVAVLDRPLVMRLVWSVGGMAVTALVATIILWFVAGKDQAKESKEESTEIALKNPFSVGPALKFAAFFVFILFVLKLAKMYLGAQGLYAAAALSGLADVDAITLSVAEQAHGGGLARNIGSIAITIAVVSNSATKTFIAIQTGGWGFGKLVAAALGAATVVGLGIAFFM